MKTARSKKNGNFKWNVWTWDVNNDKLEQYDVVPTFLMELNRLKNSEKPQTKAEFEEFLEIEARYHFWSKCEYEILILDWPKSKNEIKVDVYDQLKMNWGIFVDCFWNNVSDNLNAIHRKRRGGTAPNRAMKTNDKTNTIKGK